jgi:hypothetical protein
MTTRAWLPSDAAMPLTLWIDPADVATITLDANGAISQALDKSGNGNHFAPVSGANGPAQITVNGKTAFQDPSGSNATRSSPAYKLVSTTTGLNSVTAGPNTMVAVAAVPSYATGSAQLAFGVVTPLDTAASRAYGLAINSGTPSNSTSILRHGTAAGAATTGNVSVSGSIGVQTRSGANLVAYLDGAQVGTAATAADFSAVTGAWRINGWANAAASDGQLAPAWTGDAIVYTGVLSADDRQKLEGYLAWKWGTQARLPAAHPYKAAAPTITSTSFSLSAGVGAMTIAGGGVNLVRAANSPGAGSIVLKGMGLTPRRSYALGVSPGAVAVTLKPVLLAASRRLAAAAGAVIVLGYSAMLRRFSAPPVSRQITLSDAATSTKVFDYAMDPSDLVDFWAIISQGDDIGTLLRADENVASYTLTITAAAAAAGLQILTTNDRQPQLVDRLARFWLSVADDQQSSDLFSGAGAELALELTVVTDAVPSRRFQRSMMVKVAQQ